MVDGTGMLGLIERGRTYLGSRYTSLRGPDHLPQMLADGHTSRHKMKIKYTVNDNVTV
jgi:hypothetical protein